jgi:hypothetical protein
MIPSFGKVVQIHCPSRAEDLLYVYTNSRVLNQNVPFTNEAASEWYKQTVVSEDSDS